MQNHTQLPTGLSFSYETERLILRLPSTDYLLEIECVIILRGGWFIFFKAGAVTI
jgi:hypothetical protein